MDIQNHESAFLKVKQTQPHSKNLFFSGEGDDLSDSSKEFSYKPKPTNQQPKWDEIRRGIAQIESVPQFNETAQGSTEDRIFSEPAVLKKLKQTSVAPPKIPPHYHFCPYEVVDLTKCNDQVIESTDCPELLRDETSITDMQECTFKSRSNSFGEEIPNKRKRSFLEYSNPESKESTHCWNSECEESKQERKPTRVRKLLFSDLQEYASKKGGICCRMKLTNDGYRVSFKCRMRHSFSLKVEEIETWCRICTSMLKNAQEFAQQNEGKLLSTRIAQELEFECKAKHRWKASYKKCLRNWCKTCKQQRKKLVKQILDEEERILHEQRKNKQKELLNEARLKMLANQRKQNGQKKEYLKTFNILQEEITLIASKYARDYLKVDKTADFERILELYRVLILPEKSFQQYFDALSFKQAKKEFRKYTMNLHPDKNSHPKAKFGFQKIYGVFQLIMKTKNKE